MAAAKQSTTKEPEDRDEGAGGDERVMGFLDHLEELRWTLVKSLVVFMVAFGGIAFFVTDAAHLLNWPLDRGLRDYPESARLVTTTPFGVFSVFMMICFLGSITLTLPFILYFVGQFVAPALTRKEKRLLLPACAAALVLFLVGSAFSFFLLVPSVIKMSAYLNVTFGTDLLWSADRYYSMLVWMVLGMGAAFQFPMIIQILLYLGMIEVPQLRKWRRIAILVFFIVAALITPTPDPFNQALVALPLWFLYEVAIWVGAVYTSKLAARERESESEENSLES
ncbi:twin-arginine translocase subunit TatC [Congregicoccus parvus]|uniref:twin-arginine translocase subunit TatC n=1 Tax=Congregicoccus parvus TaxID=3081749 RepID=UPI003FA5B4FD